MATRGGREGRGGAFAASRGRGDHDGAPPGSQGQGSSRPRNAPRQADRSTPSPGPAGYGRMPSDRSLGDKARASPDYLAAMDPAALESHSRLLFILMSAVGTKVQVTVKDGSVYEGILSRSGKTDGELGLCLRMARKKGDEAGAAVLQELIVPPKELVMMTAANLEVAESSGEVRDGGFLTDTAISGFRETRERELQPWLPAEGDSLSEPIGGLEHDGRPWNQFEINERKFGVTTDFDEEFYTTKLDRSRPDFKQREREAARLAAEIEKAPAAFTHVAEERGLEVDDSGMDEEEKYSSVIRTPGKYVPPQARHSAQADASTASPAPGTAEAANGSPAGPPGGQRSSDTLSNEPTAVPSAKAARLPPQLQNIAPSTSRVIEQPRLDDVAEKFKEFSKQEKQNLKTTRQQIHSTDRDSLLNDFRKFSAGFQIKAPIPADLEPILHKSRPKGATSPKEAQSATATPSSTSTPAASAAEPKESPAEAGRSPQTPPSAEARGATPTSGSDAGKDKSKDKSKDFKFNVDAEEFTFNVGAAEFGGATSSGTRSPAFDKKGPSVARRTPSQTNWQQQGPRPPMPRNMFPPGYEEMPIMVAPPYPPNMPPGDPAMGPGPQGYYPMPGPYMYPAMAPGMMVGGRPPFIPGGPPPPMAMMPGQPTAYVPGVSWLVASCQCVLIGSCASAVPSLRSPAPRCASVPAANDAHAGAAAVSVGQGDNASEPHGLSARSRSDAALPARTR
ncbi:hypothetical protein DFJ74DRAFT_470060 [Hyaloraphidium curvatum]|nr:hypothetical protein DFJ74DRAFT_470060 [Hyaloraphidium curvatum]